MHAHSMAVSTTTTLPKIMTIDFTVRQDAPLQMPEHAGSMLRGAFGLALRSLTCVTDLPECKDCPLKQHCAFPHIFEVPALPPSAVQAVNPYVIHPPIRQQETDALVSFNPKPSDTQRKHITHPTGTIWQFGMTLMGRAATETALVIRAWQLALSRGLGAHAPYRRATLLLARCADEILYEAPKPSTAAVENGHIAAYSSTTPIAQADLQNLPAAQTLQLTMHFLTPFRYQQNNRIISQPADLDSVTFIASLYNRIRLCQQNHSPDSIWDIGYDTYHQFKSDIESLGIVVNIHPNTVPRRSNRQQRKMQLFGMQGDITLTGNAQTITRLLPALHLGERLHIGKNTTMGLGQYQLRLSLPNAAA